MLRCKREGRSALIIKHPLSLTLNLLDADQVGVGNRKREPSAPSKPSVRAYSTDKAEEVIE